MKQLSKALEAITANADRVEIHLDVESTSLRGTCFAIGGFIRQGKTELYEFSLLAEEGAAEAAPWVQENILLHLQDLPTVKTLAELYDFYGEIFFAVKNRVLELYGLEPWETAKLRKQFAVVIDNGMPVEAAFESACWSHLIAKAQEAGEDTFGIEMGGMYMPIEISTALDVLGFDPDLPRSEAAEEAGFTGPKHNPVVDARQSACVYDLALSGQLSDKYRAE